MSRSPLRDLVAGLFVLVGIAAVAFLSLRVAGDPFLPARTMRIYASFDQTGGLKPRAPVEIAGVRVGQVTAIELGPDFRARAALDVDPTLRLPVDTSASIVTAGLLGDRYISLQLGGETDYLQDGEEITFTESAVILERLIGKLVHGSAEGSGDGEQSQ
jgi:phospholipid/cholesterol/gamma-HCH transport system substrate-binding protein